MIRHMVFLRFANGVTDATIAGLYADLADLSSRIDGILDFRSHDNISVEDPVVRGFRHMFWFDFKDVETRNLYLEDEAHKAIGGRIVADLEGGADGVFVCDITL